MPKRTFSIEWHDENSGDAWMNKYNLMLVLLRCCPNTRFTVCDLSLDDDGKPHTDGPVGPDALREVIP